MLTSKLNKKSNARGFTVLEVMIAIAILAVGVLGLASLAGGMLSTGHRSKYMTLASTLASEKLEDLNRWYVEAPQICVPSPGPSVGSLTADVLQTTTCDTGASASIAYYDNVSVGLTNNSGDCPSSTAGCFAETVSTQVGGATQYVTTYHSPDGRITTSAPTSTAPSLSFHRRWIIENNSPVTGVRRITVQATSLDQSVNPAVSFQMSLVRP